MSKNQKKNLIWCILTFNPENIYDIPPTLWNRFGLKENSIEKLNFIIHLAYVKKNEWTN